MSNLHVSIVNNNSSEIPMKMGDAEERNLIATTKGTHKTITDTLRANNELSINIVLQEMPNTMQVKSGTGLPGTVVAVSL